MEQFYKQAADTIQRLKDEHRDNANFLKLAGFYAALNEQDKAGLAIVRQEMTLASKMSTLPSGERQGFFDHQIRPMQVREDEISAREIQMAIEAKKNGMPLPDDIGKRLDKSK